MFPWQPRQWWWVSLLRMREMSWRISRHFYTQSRIKARSHATVHVVHAVLPKCMQLFLSAHSYDPVYELPADMVSCCHAQVQCAQSILVICCLLVYWFTGIFFFNQFFRIFSCLDTVDVVYTWKYGGPYILITICANKMKLCLFMYIQKNFLSTELLYPIVNPIWHKHYTDTVLFHWRKW